MTVYTVAQPSARLQLPYISLYKWLRRNCVPVKVPIPRTKNGRGRHTTLFYGQDALDLLRCGAFKPRDPQVETPKQPRIARVK